MTMAANAHNPQNTSHIHCIGIGGIGVSAIARLFHEQGKVVTGSDVASSEVINNIKKLGITVFVGPHKASNVPKDVEVVMYSPAVPEENPERIEARKRGALEVSYPEMIGHIMKSFTGIAISGTHGKTTTTALIGHILITAKKDPTVIVGSLVKDFGGANEHLGKGDYMVVEGDEYKASFLNYKPKIIVLTTIEEDHLDYYRDIHHILATFEEYLLRLPKDGTVIANIDDKNIRELIAHFPNIEVISYGFSDSHVYASDISYGTKGTSFVIHEGNAYERIETSLFGAHNVSNILAAFACARKIGIEPDIIQKAIKSFQGVWRRFDIVSKKNGYTIIDDYAHHPTEIKALISALRQSYPNKTIRFVYQPHQHNRFSKLFSGFSLCFAGVSKLYLAEIYDVAGRQGKKDSSERLAIEIKNKNLDAEFFPTFKALKKALLNDAKKGDILVFVGAGDIVTLRSEVQEELMK